MASSHGQPGVALPNAMVQNHIHELAIKSMTPPRKQNTACDACRSRKVKCNRIPGQDKHCLSKNYPCTHYVQQATNEKKRNVNASRRPRALSTNTSNSPDYVSPATSYPTIQTAFHVPASFQHGLAGPPITRKRRQHNPYAEWGDLASKLEDLSYRSEFALDLVEVFFQIVHTRFPLLNPAEFKNRLELPHPPSYPPSPSVSSAASASASPLTYTASALPSTNGSFTPTTTASSTPTSLRIGSHGGAGGRGAAPLHPAIVATVLAWGAKFSEHPLLVADRTRNGGQGLLAKALIDRAREVAESLKVHRIANVDHVLAGLLLEPLQAQNPEDPSGFHTFWLAASIRHLFTLQINHKSVMGHIQDPEARGTMIFAWWMALIADAYGSAYYRRKPMIDDDDYDIDFYTTDPIVTDGDAQANSTREQLEFLGYYRASHALSRTARQMSRQLWRPASQSEGVPLAVVKHLMSLLVDWRERYLPQVGVPSNFAAEWDFISAISACASDATYHVMWIILFNAVDDYGVREVNEVVRSGASPRLSHNHLEAEQVKREIMKETLHGALRIAGLAGVLASNGYLRLDPAVMHVSCIQAGTVLARLGRPEVSNCIAALDQYSYAYEEAGEQGSEIKRAYAKARAGESELMHMASVAPRLTVMVEPHGMDTS
ncbi:hypothetical protein PUNSTDRAFT_49613 [Punctularia strigosozonata HHB-11173 SS5]|uniref:uncharacterized protein n=1 Tax=Punctularia strigosozonata (strain HHB-11173) TaxID=741275 RepID=UPI0004416F1D|nr:uncharacterized protein PUNSTDRAFT_49613 [Punctularia strigosozonata HHB-11173 SS5]EIN12374.1 hypothetical protein PUNSTDRAFT_49613 [Punctularia strigosozonata HHB-11173 SS5]